jgi:hypothetical protein
MSIELQQLQVFLNEIEKIKTATIKQQKELANFVSTNFPGFKVSNPPEIGTILRLDIYGIKIIIRSEIKTKISPPTITAKLVGYQVIKDGFEEELQPLGQPVNLNEDGMPNISYPNQLFPMIYISNLLNELLSKDNLLFTP